MRFDEGAKDAYRVRRLKVEFSFEFVHYGGCDVRLVIFLVLLTEDGDELLFGGGICSQTSVERLTVHATCPTERRRESP